MRVKLWGNTLKGNNFKFGDDTVEVTVHVVVDCRCNTMEDGGNTV